MSERRPHWDSELEQAVSAILFDCYENGISEEQVYQVVEVVEDYLLLNPSPLVPQRMREQQAVIQQIREVMDGPVGLLERRAGAPRLGGPLGAVSGAHRQQGYKRHPCAPKAVCAPTRTPCGRRSNLAVMARLSTARRGSARSRAPS